MIASKKVLRFKYIFFDLIGSFTAWFLFHLYRKQIIEKPILGDDVGVLLDTNVIIGLIVIPLFWVMILFFFGFYRDVFQRSRLKELGVSISVTFLGVILIFFLLLLDDFVPSYRGYYRLFFTLLSLQFFFTYIPRLLLTSYTIRQIRSKKIYFPTLIVGNGDKALQVLNEVLGAKKSQGNHLVGYISVGQVTNEKLIELLPCLGNLSDLRGVVKKHQVEELILAIDQKDNKLMGKIVNDIFDLNVVVKAIPSMYDILIGRVRMSAIFGVPLMQISFDLMPVWQQRIKRVIDVASSVLALVILFPLNAIIAIAIKLSSRGPVFYSQERVGQYGKPFNIYKFRTMTIDAEKDGPALSTKHDKRITRIGRFLRKTRLDEIPNFWNVLKGEMSLVGPRPERQFYIDKIVEKAPHYLHLQKVRPGITSWGQVKFGYAENVDQMVERLKFDLIYIENMSLYVDFKILIYTIITVFKGKGV
ncbi:MAG: sugar transferase [Bacteroidales bacterium]|jgi:exopolysaccharide biosynthesis polyprenyl glycosylphosphotransferase|nr:sugar transferase [Bacteroidales bacterium]